jgi:hypothetical protein
MAVMQGYIVAQSDAAMAFVASADAGKESIKPFWIPRKKIESAQELDAKGRLIKTAQNGEKIGIPFTLNVCDAFLAKVVGA